MTPPRPRPDTIASGPSATSTTDHERGQEPRNYAIAVRTHSKRPKETHLFPGDNYRQLALFLNGGAGKGDRRNGTHEPAPSSRFDFAVLHDLAFDRRDPRRVTVFDVQDGPALLAKHSLPHDNAGQLLFLRGYPSREWVNAVGSKYKINPEIFRRHLSLTTQYNLYDLPSLPSTSQNILCLSVPSLGKVLPTTSSRSKADASLQRYWNRLESAAGKVGESIVRRFSLHDVEHFSIEQEIRVTFLRRSKGWLALILLDPGRDLEDGPEGPWSGTGHFVARLENVFLPTIQFEPKVMFTPRAAERSNSDGAASFMLPERTDSNLSTVDTEMATANGLDETPNRSGIGGPQNRLQPFHQSVSLLASDQYGRFLNPELIKLDAFYALHDLFKFAAHAESQYLNCLRTKLRMENERLNQGRALKEVLQNFIYHKALVREHVNYLQSTILSFSPDEHSENLYREYKSTADAAAESLLSDYESLLAKANDLVLLYQEGIRDIRATTSLQETQKANSQAGAMARLTFLAFVFIPLSFTTSFFGMNFRELGDDLSIGYWFAVTLPLFMVTLAIYHATKIKTAFGTFLRGLGEAKKRVPADHAMHDGESTMELEAQESDPRMPDD